PAASHSASRASTLQLLRSISRNRVPLTTMRARPPSRCSIWTKRSAPGTFRLRKSGSVSGRMWVWTSIFSKSAAGRRRRGRRHDGAALLAGALLLVGEEPVEDRRKVLLDVVEGEVLLVQEVRAAVAVPLEPVLLVRQPLALDDEPDGVRHPLRGVGDTRRVQVDLAGADRDVHDLAALDRLQNHLAFE